MRTSAPQPARDRQIKDERVQHNVSSIRYSVAEHVHGMVCWAMHALAASVMNAASTASRAGRGSHVGGDTGVA